MAITLRADSGSALSHNQVDTNFTSFYYSSSISGNTVTLFKTGSGALNIPVESSSIDIPGGTLWTASAVDISRYSDVTITGSFKQGSPGLVATGLNSHAQGISTQAIGWHSHAEGRETQARESGSHAEGYLTIATGSYSHAEGLSTTAIGIYSHAEGQATTARGQNSHAEGLSTISSGSYSHAEGVTTITRGYGSHAEGNLTISSGSYSHAEGITTIAIGQGSHAEGGETISKGTASHTEGYLTTAVGNYSHAEGSTTLTTGAAAHSEGYYTTASGNYSHAEGELTLSRGASSHAEGYGTVSSGSYSHAEGLQTVSSGSHSHAEGSNTIASGSYSHAEGAFTRAEGIGSHAEGLGTVASGLYQHTQGQYNISSSAQSAFIIGNGTDNNNRSNLVFATGSQFQITGSLNVLGPINTVGNLVVQGDVTAQQYIVSTSVYYVTESYSSGSHIFGNSIDDTHQFTGSVLVTGSVRISGSLQATGSIGLQGSLSAGINVIAGSTVQAPVIQPTTALILDGFGNNGLKPSGSTANIFVLNAFTVGSGSFAAANSAEYIRINSGGLTINNGFDLIAHGNKQFNYGMFFHTASITVANGTSGSALLSTTAVANGVSIVSGSRITIENPGYYNIQFSAQLAQGSNTANYSVWFKKNGTNVANSNSTKTLANNTNALMTVNIIDYASTAGDYYEIAHQSDQSNSSIAYIAATGNIPATPAIIVTVSQVR